MILFENFKSIMKAIIHINKINMKILSFRIFKFESNYQIFLLEENKIKNLGIYFKVTYNLSFFNRLQIKDQY